MGKHGGKSVRQRSRAQDAVRRACDDTFMEHCAPQYAQQLLDGGIVVDGGLRDIDVAWVAAHTTIPRQAQNVVCECVHDARQLLAAAAGECAGDNLTPGTNMTQAASETLHSGATVGPQLVGKTAAQRGTGVAQSGDDMVLGDKQITTHFVRLLADLRGVPRLIAGFEVQWESAVGAALADLQSEFELHDILGRFRNESRMSQVLFVRELKAKAVRILAHKKMKAKKQNK